jgi:hypothetical protein
VESFWERHDQALHDPATIARMQAKTGADRLKKGMMTLIVAISYTVAAITSLAIGFVAVPRDPLNFIPVVALGLPGPC